MKKNTHLPVHQIIYYCISCNQQYQTISTSSQNIRIEGSCSNCNSFYTGSSASEVKFGAVEKFRQRVQKSKEKLTRKS